MILSLSVFLHRDCVPIGSVVGGLAVVPEVQAILAQLQILSKGPLHPLQYELSAPVMPTTKIIALPGVRGLMLDGHKGFDSYKLR